MGGGVGQGTPVSPALEEDCFPPGHLGGDTTVVVDKLSGEVRPLEYYCARLLFAVVLSDDDASFVSAQTGVEALRKCP